MELHRTRLQEARERARYAFEARDQAIGRIGLPAVRAYRRRRLEQEHKERMATLDAAETSLPDLNAIMMLRVGPGFASESVRDAVPFLAECIHEARSSASARPSRTTTPAASTF
jgi:hypothetical protein